MILLNWMKTWVWYVFFIENLPIGNLKDKIIKKNINAYNQFSNLIHGLEGKSSNYLVDVSFTTEGIPASIVLWSFFFFISAGRERIGSNCGHLPPPEIQ